MGGTVVHIVSAWGDEGFYRLSPTGQLQSLRNSGDWAATKAYGGTLEGVIDFYTRHGDTENWSFEWVNEEDAQYAPEG